jgi:hypothetical protein
MFIQFDPVYFCHSWQKYLARLGAGNKLNFLLLFEPARLIGSLMATGNRWTRDQLLIVLNLYHKLRFGQFDQRQPVIIDLADRIGRTPSAVAMKLSNLASLDPALRLRGIQGLKGASNLDRTVWEEFHENTAELVPLSQERFDALFTESENESTEVIPGTGIRRSKRPPNEDTEITRPTKQRRGQDYFREIVLNNYDNRCALTGLPIRELLIASHILPWSDHEAERLNVRNGIALNRLHDAAFDQGLISFDDDLRMILSNRIKAFLPQDSVKSQFEDHAGKSLDLSVDGIPPDAGFLAKHRKIFEFAA